MNEEVKTGLFLIASLVTTILLLVGATKAGKGLSFWAIPLLIIGAFLIVCAIIVITLVVLSDMKSPDPGNSSFLIAIASYFILSLGVLLYAIAFLGFCARWGATGKRRSELLEVTAALTAARDQAQRNPNPTYPTS